MGLVVFAVGYRYYLHGSSFRRAFQDFFFRYGFGLVATNFIFMIFWSGGVGDCCDCIEFGFRNVIVVFGIR